MPGKTDWFTIALVPSIALLASLLVMAVFFLPGGTLLIPVILVGLLAWLVSRLEWHSWLFMAIAFCLPLSVSIGLTGDTRIIMPTEPLLGVMAVVFLWDAIRLKGFLRDSLRGESAWVIPFLAILILSIPFSTNFAISAKFSAVNIVYILVFFIQLRQSIRMNPGLFHKLVSLFSLSIFLVILFSLYTFSQFDWNPLVVKGIFRPFYPDHTIVGASCAILTVYWTGRAFNGRPLQGILLNLFPGILFMSTVVLSGSRAAILSLPVAGVLYVLWRLRFGFHHFMMLLAASLVLIFIFRAEIGSRLQQNRFDSSDLQADLVEQTASVGNVTTDVSNLERINRWVAGYRMFRQRPLTGFGPGTYQFEYIPFQDKKYMNRLSVEDPYNIPENSGGSAHSEYILALSEMGFPGFLAWVLILFRLTYISFRKPGFRQGNAFALTGFLAISTYMFHAFFNNFLTTDAFAFLFWSMAAWLSVNAGEALARTDTLKTRGIEYSHDSLL